MAAVILSLKGRGTCDIVPDGGSREQEMHTLREVLHPSRGSFERNVIARRYMNASVSVL